MTKIPPPIVLPDDTRMSVPESEARGKAAFERAMELHLQNYPHENVERHFKVIVFKAALQLGKDGMTDIDFIASFALSRARRRTSQRSWSYDT